MKVSILVILVILPMLASIGLYSYGFISTRWNAINNDFIFQQTQKFSQDYINEFNSNETIQLEYQSIGFNIRTRYGLFGYCQDYKLFQLLTMKTKYNNNPMNCSSCMKSDMCCKETNRCIKSCNNRLECPSHIDEHSCLRNYHQTDYYWNEGKCMWHSYLFDIQGIPRWLISCFRKSQIKPIISNVKLIRYYIMLILFLTAPLLTLFGLLILYSISCIDRFYSIPFAFLSYFSFGSFSCGLTALGIFIYDWIDRRLYEFNDKIDINHVQQSIVALNPWINQIETFGPAFWIVLGAIGLNLLTSLLSCCFCCGLQSEKSKLRIHVNNDKYAIVHTNLYDD